jgi:hypothetical protein
MKVRLRIGNNFGHGNIAKKLYSLVRLVGGLFGALKNAIEEQSGRFIINGHSFTHMNCNHI